MRKPLVHIMPIPGCENYNANYFSKKQMSIKCDNIEQVINITKELMENKILQENLIKNQEKYIDKNTCEKIAELIIKQLDRGNREWKNIPKKKVTN